MKMLKRLFWLPWLWLSWPQLSWRRRENPREDHTPTSFSPPLVDAQEFARLICSGRVEDLRILARKLSAQAKAHV